MRAPSLAPQLSFSFWLLGIYLAFLASSAMSLKGVFENRTHHFRCSVVGVCFRRSNLNMVLNRRLVPNFYGYIFS